MRLFVLFLAVGCSGTSSASQQTLPTPAPAPETEPPPQSTPSTSEQENAPIVVLLNSFGRAALKLGLPSPEGEYRLDIWDNEFMQTHPDGKMSAAQQAEAEAMFQRGAQSYDPNDPQVSIEIMRSITHRFPFWGKGHIAMYDGSLQLERLEDAAYHLAQYLMLHPSPLQFSLLGQLLGKLDRLDDSELVLRHTLHLEGLSSSLILDTTKDLLVTLSRLFKGEEMIEVARGCEAQVGFEPAIAYQELLGLIISKRQQEAWDLVEGLNQKIPTDHPIRPKFKKLTMMLTSQVASRPVAEKLSNSEHKSVEHASLQSDLVDIVLVSYDEEAEGFSRGKLVRVVREITGLGIKDGKALVESAPSVICNGVSRVEAAALRQKLESVGAIVVLRTANDDE